MTALGGPSPPSGAAPAATGGCRSRRVGRSLARWVGWTLIAAGGVTLLYVVYLLFYTNTITERAQGALLERWKLEYGPVDEAVSGPAPPAAGPTDGTRRVEVGEAYAVMWFERPGAEVRPVHADPLFVVEGVDPETLKKGPGHYPATAGPGEPGNFAVAGHRTTYGAPFYHLDQLRPGDGIHVVDRQQRTWTYEVIASRLVLPDDVWVVGPDPLETGQPMLTLTTCEPRFSAAQRLIVFAQLRPKGD